MEWVNPPLQLVQLRLDCESYTGLFLEACGLSLFPTCKELVGRGYTFTLGA